MTRRVVSYTEIDTGEPDEATASSLGLASAGSSSATGLSSDIRGKRKRKGGKDRQAAPHKNAKISSGTIASAARNNVHWDNPDYVRPSTPIDDLWRQEDASTNIHIEEDIEDEDEFFDARSDSASDHADHVEATGSQPQYAYTAWKYDENGELFDKSDALQHEDDEAFEEEDELEDYDLHADELEEDGDPGFMVPDLDEFNRTWQAENGETVAISETPRYSATTRPPFEVGGGGRPLTQSEIWGPTAITDAWSAAVQEFDELHTDPSSSEAAKVSSEATPSRTSALWHDAPGHDSLLARQIQLDTQQILQQKAQERKGKAAKPKANQAPVVVEDAAMTQTATIIDRKAETNRGPSAPKQTFVPSAKLSGNSAWKKAVKTVRNTPNSVGQIVKPACGEETSDQKPATEELLNEYWYAGYRAGLADASKQTHAAV